MNDTAGFQRDGFYLMLALDHRGSFKEMLGEKASREEVVARKKEIIEALGTKPSGLLLDIEYGLPALSLIGSTTPYLLAMEKSGYEERGALRHTELVYSGEEIKNAGARGIKLLLYMKGDASDASQVEVGKEAYDRALAVGLPLFLEVVIYGDGRSAVGERTVAAMQALKMQGVNPAVWKLEAPGTPELCAKYTEAAEQTPWILLSRGADFEHFAWELKESVASGCKGFLAGRSLWQEALSLEASARATFFAEMRDRFDTLASIAAVH